MTFKLGQAALQPANKLVNHTETNFKYVEDCPEQVVFYNQQIKFLKDTKTNILALEHLSVIDH